MVEKIVYIENIHLLTRGKVQTGEQLSFSPSRKICPLSSFSEKVKSHPRSLYTSHVFFSSIFSGLFQLLAHPSPDEGPTN